MTNITITDHDLFENKTRDEKKRANSENKNVFYPLA